MIETIGYGEAGGDKITFVADENERSWDVINFETLKDHVGHHVERSAHVYKDKGRIHVMLRCSSCSRACLNQARDFKRNESVNVSVEQGE
jgi:hypothetical protein